MSKFTVSSSQLRNAAETLRGYNSQFKSQVDGLVQDEAALAGQWSGDAQKAFRTAFQNDKAQFDNFHAGIEKYIQALTEIAQKYDTAEDKNVSTATTRKA